MGRQGQERGRSGQQHEGPQVRPGHAGQRRHVPGPAPGVRRLRRQHDLHLRAEVTPDGANERGRPRLGKTCRIAGGLCVFIDTGTADQPFSPLPL